MEAGRELRQMVPDEAVGQCNYLVSAQYYSAVWDFVFGWLEEFLKAVVNCDMWKCRCELTIVNSLKVSWLEQLWTLAWSKYL
jgi:hypothetical protein